MKEINYEELKRLPEDSYAFIDIRDLFIEANIFKSVENVNLDTVVAYKKDGVRHHFLDEY